MPNGDRTGPEGIGPRTGRGLGYCNDYESPGYTRGTPRCRGVFGRGYGKGLGRGFALGFRRGQRRGFIPINDERNIVIKSNQDERSYLETMLLTLENEIKEVKNRLHEIKNDSKK